MNEITINGKKFQFQRENHGEDDYVIWTHFYDGMIEEIYRKYFFFGKKLKRLVPKEVFFIEADINDERLTAGWWRKAIEHEIELMGRKEELKKGQFI